jgi:hypothetical protein
VAQWRYRPRNEAHRTGDWLDADLVIDGPQPKFDAARAPGEEGPARFKHRDAEDVAVLAVRHLLSDDGD